MSINIYCYNITLLVLIKKEGFRSRAGRAIWRNVTIKQVGPDPESTVQSVHVYIHVSAPGARLSSKVVYRSNSVCPCLTLTKSTFPKSSMGQCLHPDRPVVMCVSQLLVCGCQAEMFALVIWVSVTNLHFPNPMYTFESFFYSGLLTIVMFRCQSHIDKTFPGVWLPRKMDVYLSVSTLKSHFP